MSLPIRSTADILEALRAHPAWKNEVRRELLTEELLELPATVRALAESQRRTEATLQSFMESTRAFQHSMEEFRRSMEEFRRSMEEFRRSMEEFKDASERRFVAIEQELRGIGIQMNELDGKRIELDAERKLGNYLRKYVRMVEVISDKIQNRAIDIALMEGTISEKEGEEIGNADVLAAGEDPETGEAACAAVEVSRTVDVSDVERAHRRAKLLLKALQSAVASKPSKFRETFPVPPSKSVALVVGKRISEAARREAERRGVVYARYRNGFDREEG